MKGRVSHTSLYNAGFYLGHTELNPRLFYMAYIVQGIKVNLPAESNFLKKNS